MRRPRSEAPTGIAAGAVAAGLLLAVGIGMGTVPRWPDAARAEKLQDRVDALEKHNARLLERVNRLDGSVTLLADQQKASSDRVEAVAPSGARRIALTGGGTERWELPTGAAYVQFLRFDAAGRPVFTIKTAGGEAEVALAPGLSHVAVDDRGEERRVHTTTLHRIFLDRTGAPRQALVSVRFERKRL